MKTIGQNNDDLWSAAVVNKKEQDLTIIIDGNRWCHPSLKIVIQFLI